MISNELLKKKILDEAIHGRLVKNDLSLKPIDAQSTDKDIPFEIPSNWKWSTLKNNCEKLYAGGDKPLKYSKEKTRELSIPVIANGVNNDGIIGYTDFPTETDICLTISGRGTIGYTSIRDYPFTPIVRLITIKPKDYLNVSYLKHVMEFETESSKGTSIPQLTIPMIKNKLVPIPPIEEQEKIVRKIEELFELIDKKEKNDKEKEELKALLKEKILDSAIHGKLVENDLSLPAVDVEEVKENVQFEIPSNWKWSHIKCIGDVIGGGTPRTGNNEYWNGNINWISPADMKSTDKYITRGKKSITEKGLIESSARLMPKGTLIISSRAPIGYVKISNEPISTSQGCKSIVINNPEIFNEYIFYYIKSISNYLNELGTGTTFKEISGKTLGNVLVNIPPLEQQKKIVEKIEECFKLIEQL